MITSERECTMCFVLFGICLCGLLYVQGLLKRHHSGVFGLGKRGTGLKVIRLSQKRIPLDFTEVVDVYEHIFRSIPSRPRKKKVSIYMGDSGTLHGPFPTAHHVMRK